MFSQMRIGRGGYRRGGFRRRGNLSRRPVNQNSSGAQRNPAQQNGSRPRPNSQNVRCYNCGGTGHFKNQCRKPRRTNGQASQQNRDRNPRPRAHIAEAFMMSSEKYASKDDKEYKVFIVDSGATDHLVRSKDWFETFSKSSDTREVRLGSSDRLPVRGSGNARLTVTAVGGIVDFELKNVLYVPGLRKNLLSISKLTANGFVIKFARNVLTIRKDGITIVVPKVNGLYKMRVLANGREQDLNPSQQTFEKGYPKFPEPREEKYSDSDGDEYPSQGSRLCCVP